MWDEGATGALASGEPTVQVSWQPSVLVQQRHFWREGAVAPSSMGSAGQGGMTGKRAAAAHRLMPTSRCFRRKLRKQAAGGLRFLPGSLALTPRAPGRLSFPADLPHRGWRAQDSLQQQRRGHSLFRRGQLQAGQVRA